MSPPQALSAYLVSLCGVCSRHLGQNLDSSSLSGSFFLFLNVVYVLSLHLGHARWMMIRASPFLAIIRLEPASYSIISVTTPAPTVRPPSRMAKRSSFSKATGWMSCTFISTLSPGITISVPSGSSEVPVTSVVRR